MKKRKRYGFLAGLCMFAALLVIYIRMGAAPEDEENNKPYQVEHPVETIARAGKDGTSWTLVNRQGQWVWSEDSTFPVNQEMAAMMAAVAAGPETVTSMEMTPDNRKWCGLEAPVYTITAAGSGEQYTLYFGDQNSATGDYYFCVEGIDRIYTTGQRNFNIFNHDLLELAEPETMPGVRLDQVSGFQVVQNTDGLSLEKKADGDDRQWLAEDGAGHVWQAEAVKAEEAISRFLRLKLVRMAVFSPTETELGQYGLNTPEAVVTLTYQTEEKNECRFELIFGNPDESGLYRYCWFENSKGIYLTGETDFQALLQQNAADYADLCLTAVRPEDVKTMEVATPDAVHQIQITAAGADTPQKTIMWNGTEVEAPLFNQFYYELYGLKGDKLAEEDAPAQNRPMSGVEILRITIEQENGNREELVVQAYDRNYHLVKRDGTVEMLINRQKINGLLRLLEQSAP